MGVPWFARTGNHATREGVHRAHLAEPEALECGGNAAAFPCACESQSGDVVAALQMEVAWSASGARGNTMLREARRDAAKG